MKIKNYDIKNEDSKTQFHIIEADDTEFVSPVDYVANLHINSCIWLEKTILATKGLKSPPEIMDKILLERALKDWDVEFHKLISLSLPDNLFQLLEVKTKKEQIKLLKNLSLTSDELIAFYFMAFIKHGFKYSQYKAHHLSNGLENVQLPIAVHLEKNGIMTTIGDTVLTKGQQKQLIEHRKVIISNFLDKDETWHCFFLTYRSLGGKESHKKGQPHLHYISDKWGLKRKEVLDQLKSKDYHLPALPHIDFHTHRNPR